LLIKNGAQLHPLNDQGVVPYWYTNREAFDLKVAESVRKEIQTLLPNPPDTQIYQQKGDIVFGKSDVQ
jgi:hypothetical protein